jgi:hypothetical protein
VKSVPKVSLTHSDSFGQISNGGGFHDPLLHEVNRLLANSSTAMSGSEYCVVPCFLIKLNGPNQFSRHVFLPGFAEKRRVLKDSTDLQPYFLGLLPIDDKAFSFGYTV